MTIQTDLLTYTQWSAIATVGCLILAVIAFIAKWSFRFRLIGATGFMGVLTLGIFALSLGLFTHTEIPGTVRYSLVYDNGANQAVVAVKPDIATSAIEPTLRQAASDLYSYGRTGTNGNDRFKVKLRTVLHPQTGVSQPLYLGEASRSLIERSEDNIQIKIFTENLAKLPQTTNS